MIKTPPPTDAFCLQRVEIFFLPLGSFYKKILSSFAPPSPLPFPPSPTPDQQSHLVSSLSALQSLGVVVSATYLLESMDLIAGGWSGHGLNTEVTEHCLQCLISTSM